MRKTITKFSKIVQRVFLLIAFATVSPFFANAQCPWPSSGISLYGTGTASSLSCATATTGSSLCHYFSEYGTFNGLTIGNTYTIVTTNTSTTSGGPFTIGVYTSTTGGGSPLASATSSTFPISVTFVATTTTVYMKNFKDGCISSGSDCNYFTIQCISCGSDAAVTSQPSTSGATVGASNIQIVRLGATSCTAADVTSITFSTNGSTNPTSDISSAAVYYTSSTTFSTSTPFGVATINPNGTFTVTGTQSLAASTIGYFWLVYNVSCTAVLADVLDASVESYVIGGNTVVPASTNPTGTRAITAVTAPTFSAITTGNVTVGAPSVDMGRFGVTGTSCVTNVTQVVFNNAAIAGQNNGGTAVNIDSARCFYVTTSSSTAIDVPFGTAVVQPNGDIVFNGNQPLAASGSNYFWLSYSVGCSSNVGDSLKVAPSSITTNMGATSFLPLVNGPKKTIVAATAPAYTSTTSTSVNQGAVKLAMGRISISGSSCVNNVTEVKFNVSTTPLLDIINAKCYYTTSTTFTDVEQFGGVVLSPTGDIVFTGSKNLPASTSYFWLTYDISCAATISDAITALPVSITYNGTTTAVSGTTTAKSVAAAVLGTTVADGDWSNPAIWTCGVMPISTTNVVINNAVTVSTASNLAANVTIASGKSLTITSGSLTMGAVGGDNKVFTNNGTLTVSGGTFNINGQFVNAANATFNQSGGNINVDPNASGSGTSVTGSTNYPVNLNFATAANANLTGGVFTLVDPPSASSSSGYAMYVTYSPVGSLAAGPNHTFRFGDGISTDAGGATGFRYYSWNGSGVFKFGKLILEANSSNAASRFVYINGTYFNLSATDDIVIKSGAELRQTGTAMTGAIYVGKNLTVESGGTLTVPGIIYFGNVTSTSATGLATSAATGTQTVIGEGAIFRNSETTSTANFGSMVVNNTDPTGVTFADANSLLSGANTGTVSGTFTLTAGNVNVGSNTLVLGISSSSTGTYSYTAGMINGKFKRWLGASTGSRTFDIGTASGSKQVTINFTTAPSSGGSLTATFSATNPGNAGLPLTDGSTTYTNASASGYWTVSVGDGLSGGVYSASFRGTGFNDVADYNTLTLGKRNTSGDDWTLVGTHVAPTGSNGNFVVLRTGISGFSDFGILSSVEPLEVKLLSFNGYNAGKTNILNWETVSEKNFRFFELQRSADASKFVSIAKIDGQNTGGGKYQYEDESPLSGRNFYRLKMVDINGNAVISKVIEVSSKTGNTLIVSAHPNPVKQLLQINIEGAMDVNPGIQIFDIVGKLILTVKPTGNNTNIDMSSVADGTYIVRYTDNSHSYTTKIRKN